MSLSRDNFDTESESVLAEFVCAICLNVPLPNEASISTKACQHVFCGNCLAEWKQKSERCPTCNRTTDSTGTRSNLFLKDHCPLGFRVLGRLKVRCSLKSCPWKGDLSDLDAHLTNSDNHNKDISTTASLKDVGNERFAAGHYEEALKMYDKALSTASDDDPIRIVLQANRAAAFLKLGKPTKAAEACEKAVKLGSRDVKVFVRWSQALTQVGKFDVAVKVLSEEVAPKELVPSLLGHYRRAKALLTGWEDSGKAIEQSDHEHAKVCLSSLLQDPNANRYSRVISRAALIEAHIGNIDVALRLSLEAARSSPEDEQAWIARAHALVSNGQFDEARLSAKQALRLNPDDESAKSANRFVKFVETAVTGARQAADRHDWENARALLLDLVTGTTLPKVSPLRVQLLAERAHVSFCAGLFEEALRDANQAIYHQDDCQRAWLTKFYCLRELGRHEEAVREARELLNRWGAGDSVIRNVAEKAEFELRKSKRPDFYALLGVPSLASEMEIKQAYKQKALICHPDKLSPSATAEERKQYEEQFKLLGSALDVLGNQEKRELYDRGYDVQGIQEELERRRRRSHHS